MYLVKTVNNTLLILSISTVSVLPRSVRGPRSQLGRTPAYSLIHKYLFSRPQTFSISLVTLLTSSDEGEVPHFG